MTRNQLLIEKYQDRIAKMELELASAKGSARKIILNAKISVLKLVVIDLQE